MLEVVALACVTVAARATRALLRPRAAGARTPLLLNDDAVQAVDMAAVARGGLGCDELNERDTRELAWTLSFPTERDLCHKISPFSG